MQKLAILIAVLLLSIPVGASQTWVIHGSSKAFLSIEFRDPVLLKMMLATWNYQKPEQSGVTVTTDIGWTTYTGYSDVLTITEADTMAVDFAMLTGLKSRKQNKYLWTELPPGEYWIDYDAFGVGRIETVMPSDFGMWTYKGQ